MKRFFLSLVTGLLLAVSAFAQVPIYTRGGTANSVSASAFPLSSPDGTKAAPSYSFASEAGLGWYRPSSNMMALATGGADKVRILNAGGFEGIGTTGSFMLGAAGSDLSSTAADTFLTRDAANMLAMKNSTNAQTFRVYFSTTGPVHLGITGRTAGGVLTATGGAMQLSTVQTTVPVCSTNCGTSPSVAGTDTAMIVTLGTTPASGFLVTFNGTWPAAPSCVAAANTAGTTKAVTSITTTTTTATVTTAAAPATGDKYNLICLGVS